MPISAVILQICIAASSLGTGQNVPTCPEVLAIAEIESGFNPGAVGGVGEIGLFQIRPEYWGNPGRNIQGQIRQGLKVLGIIKARCFKDLTQDWISCHNVGVSRGKRLKGSKKGPYRLKYIKVADKWRKWYDSNKSQILLENMRSSYSSSVMVKTETFLQD